MRFRVVDVLTFSQWVSSVFAEKKFFYLYLYNLLYYKIELRVVRQDIALSNQIFSKLEEWERILQGLSGDIFMDMPEPEFWPRDYFILKPDRFDPAFLFAQPPGLPSAPRYPVPLSKKVIMNVREEKIRLFPHMFPRFAWRKSGTGTQSRQHDNQCLYSLGDLWRWCHAS